MCDDSLVFKCYLSLKCFKRRNLIACRNLWEPNFNIARSELITSKRLLLSLLQVALQRKTLLTLVTRYVGLQNWNKTLKRSLSLHCCAEGHIRIFWNAKKRTEPLILVSKKISTQLIHLYNKRFPKNLKRLFGVLFCTNFLTETSLF